MTCEEKTILLLGGTGEAAELNQLLADDPAFHLVTSLAGRTDTVTGLSGELLPEGFQAYGGLETFLKDRNVRLVIDATHPFATDMSEKVVRICKSLEVKYLRLERPSWQKVEGDHWIEVPDMRAAAKACEAFSRIFLSVGRQELNVFENLVDKVLVVRSVMETGFENFKSEIIWLQQKGPFKLSDETRLLEDHAVEVIVSKNSGGAATYAKLEAARTLGLPVIMIGRKTLETKPQFTTVQEILSEVRLFASV
ncbi:cobalt-precorrin-6A reductase [Sneathiella limimaris]|uniref:cobalt-precorrin-6A reductase n=1 Tax=Sneathiella limimaris TaxID=1964213 RepID=UPI001469C8B7|nr:cobalt-precorrin-6A reductase [Sneathiella limimaris]